MAKGRCQLRNVKEAGLESHWDVIMLVESHREKFESNTEKH